VVKKKKKKKKKRKKKYDSGNKMKFENRKPKEIEVWEE
jgi:hypothetical protein